MHFSRPVSVLIFCGIFSALACVEDKADKKTKAMSSPSLFEAVAEKSLDQRVTDWSKEYLKKDKGIVDSYHFVVLDQRGISLLKYGEGKQVMLNLFEGANFQAIIDRREQRSSAKGDKKDESVWVWEGHIQSIEDSSFTLTCLGEKIEGEVRTSNATYEIRPCPEGRKEPREDRRLSLHVVTQVKDEDFPLCTSHKLKAPEEPKKKAPEGSKAPVKTKKKEDGK